jgi:hypothetical protein
MLRRVEVLRAFQTLITISGPAAGEAWLRTEHPQLTKFIYPGDGVLNAFDCADFIIEILESHDHLCGWCHWQGDANNRLSCPECGDMLIVNRFAERIRKFEGGLGTRWPNGKCRRDGSPIP